ncbi:hypothetical protein H0O01_02550 [Candidatus Micrarchaeota archaeon]|nr:hypothetical protein [Candidatus Micrarchaeota archaeon]
MKTIAVLSVLVLLAGCTDFMSKPFCREMLGDVNSHFGGGFQFIGSYPDINSQFAFCGYENKDKELSVSLGYANKSQYLSQSVEEMKENITSTKFYTEATDKKFVEKDGYVYLYATGSMVDHPSQWVVLRKSSTFVMVDVGADKKEDFYPENTLLDMALIISEKVD